MLDGCSDSAMFARVACSRGLVLQAGLLQLQTLQHALVSRFQTAEVLLRGYKHGIDQLIVGATPRDSQILLASRWSVLLVGRMPTLHCHSPLLPVHRIPP